MTTSTLTDQEPLEQGVAQREISGFAIVKIPPHFVEEKVKFLMSSMEAQFEGTSHKVIFIPKEVDISIVECYTPTASSKRSPRQG